MNTFLPMGKAEFSASSIPNEGKRFPWGLVQRDNVLKVFTVQTSKKTVVVPFPTNGDTVRVTDNN